MRAPTPRLLAAAALAIVPLAACSGDDGGSSDNGSGGPGTTGGPGDAALVVGTKDSLEFDRELYQADAGELTVVLQQVGEASLNHTLVIEGIPAAEFRLSVTGRGDTDDGVIELEAGEYQLICDVPGHQSAGMQARLVVE